MNGLVGVPEDEEEADQEDDGVEGDPECVGPAVVGELYERMIIDAVIEILEVEHVHGKMDAERQGGQDQYGEDDVLDQVVEPGHAEQVGFLVLARHLGDMGEVVADPGIHAFFLVAHDQMPDGDDGEDGGQLEVPPYEDEQGSEDEPGKGHDHRDARHRQGDPSKDAVALVRLFSSSEADQELPAEKEDQEGREEDVHQGIGHEEHAATDDDDGGEDGGEIELDAVLELFGLQADEECGDDGRQQPYEGVGEAECLGVEHAVVAESPVDQDGNQDAEQHGDIAPLLFGNHLVDGFDVFENGQE